MKWAVIGGRGFLGSHINDYLLNKPETTSVIVYDNFSASKHRKWHYEHHFQDPRFKVIKANVEDNYKLVRAIEGVDVVIHLASNADISAANVSPNIDFWQGTALTNSVIEAVRKAGVKKLLYASGSGVYGDCGHTELKEDHGEMLPISTYGASKLAGEALICSYSHMFNLQSISFRFGNLAGGRQTHGVALDFLKRLIINPKELYILGDGEQLKSYIHVHDVINAVMLANEKCKSLYQVFNVATGDYISVNDIARLAVECLGLKDVKFTYSGNDRGWKGDVPVVKLNTDRIKSLGWKCSMTSKMAIKSAMMDMIPDIKKGRMI